MKKTLITIALAALTTSAFATTFEFYPTIYTGYQTYKEIDDGKTLMTIKAPFIGAKIDGKAKGIVEKNNTTLNVGARVGLEQQIGGKYSDKAQAEYYDGKASQTTIMVKPYIEGKMDKTILRLGYIHQREYLTLSFDNYADTTRKGTFNGVWVEAEQKITDKDTGGISYEMRKGSYKYDNWDELNGRKPKRTTHEIGAYYKHKFENFDVGVKVSYSQSAKGETITIENGDKFTEPKDKGIKAQLFITF